MRRRDVMRGVLAAASLAPFSARAAPSAEKLLGPRIAAAAEAQWGVTLIYDPSYTRLDYPMGDVPLERGVCADVVIRALRAVAMDLQVLVHQDMRTNFSAYPKVWGLKATDRNIDHRRVLNLETFFTRKNCSLELGADLRPGDFVTWRLPGNLPHIGVISSQRNQNDTRPLVAHNVGAGVQIEDVLQAWPIKGRYRFPARA